jgi:hypothetical protein
MPWITDYHMLKNKRYIITKNSHHLCQVWNVDEAKLVKTYQSKSFDQVVKMMDSRYDLQPNQTPYPYSWFAVDIKLGCLTIHLDEDNWSKCNVSEMMTNVELMMSSHIMDQGSKINYDIEEKQINLGRKLVYQMFTQLMKDLNLCEHETAKDQLGDNFKDFKFLYNYHMAEIKKHIEDLE